MLEWALIQNKCNQCVKWIVARTLFLKDPFLSGSQFPSCFTSKHLPSFFVACSWTNLTSRVRNVVIHPEFITVRDEYQSWRLRAKIVWIPAITQVVRDTKVCWGGLGGRVIAAGQCQLVLRAPNLLQSACFSAWLVPIRPNDLRNSPKLKLVQVFFEGFC